MVPRETAGFGFRFRGRISVRGQDSGTCRDT